MDGNRRVKKSIERNVEDGRLNETVVTVVRAVADAKGIDERELTTGLYDVINPEALERLFEDKGNGMPRRGGRVVFMMEGCEVTVHSYGKVVVTPQATEGNSESTAQSTE